MKTERRHELQTNELADWMGARLNKLRPHAKLITGVFVLLAAMVFLWSFFSSQRQKRLAQAWTNLFAIQVDAGSLPDPISRGEIAAKLVGLSDEAKNTAPAAWARQSAGDINLALGADLLSTDRADARARFETAREDYAAALELATHDMLRQRALMGLAQANEALNNFSKAEDRYQELIDKWPDGGLAKTAEKRLTFLQRPTTQQFYDWFMKQKPVAPRPPISAGGIPGEQSSPFGPVVPPESSTFPNGIGGNAQGADASGDKSIRPLAEDLGLELPDDSSGSGEPTTETDSSAPDVEATQPDQTGATNEQE